jgi:uroporphyrin-III C-methyltransferase
VKGTVHLVGAGPGAAELLTLRAARLLGEAQIVFHDALVSADILALAGGAEKVAVGKRSGRYATGQSFINKQLADAARRYRTVVRLKGGDPMLFGRAHEEIEFLTARGIAVRVVPGVTAALAASAELGISFTRRGEARSVTFVTPRVGEGTRESSWIRAVLAADTAAIYMGAGEGDAIAAALLQAGKSSLTPVAVMESASTPEAAVTYTTLGALGRAQGEGPMLILMGDVFGEAVAAAIADGRRYRRTYTAAGAPLGGTGLFRRKPSQSA